MPGHYDLWTVMESFLIACLGGFAAFESVDHMRFSPRKHLWTVLGGTALGLGIWSMHFVGMIAWHAPFPLYYAIGPTVLSVILAICASVMALWLVAREEATSVVARIGGALLVGTGICSMHYVGMSALRFSGETMWSKGWVFTSFVIAVGASWVAMQLLRHRGHHVAGLPQQLTGSVVIAVAICGMHYVGMHAFMMSAGSVGIESPGSLGGAMLAQVGVANAMLFTIGLLVASYRDKELWVELVQRSRMAAMEAARRLDSMAAVGKIAASVAHEINNPLEAVTNLLYLMEGGEIGETERGYLDAAQQELKRISNITTQTLKFYRQQNPATATSIPELLDSLLLLFHASIQREQIEVRRDWPTNLPLVRCREGEIRQVLANLVSNAIDAMAGGGVLTLAVRAGEDRLSVEIRDTGAGMPAHVQSKILEPFFTTKGIAGTGLGLSISSEIVARHGGTLTFVSSDGDSDHGTCFTVVLPFEASSNLDTTLPAKQPVEV